MSTPGVEPGLSRPRRDVLTTRRCGLSNVWFTCLQTAHHHGWTHLEGGPCILETDSAPVGAWAAL